MPSAPDPAGKRVFAVSQDPLAAVRERIAEMRSAAAEDRVSAAGWRDDIDGPDTEHAAYNERRAESLEWAANALGAVLEDAPCDRCNARRDRHPIRNIGEREPHDFVFSARLEAALTRATATTEGVR